MKNSEKFEALENFKRKKTKEKMEREREEKMKKEGKKRDVHRPKGNGTLTPTIPIFNMELILGIK
jgi:hypothetical protein